MQIKKIDKKEDKVVCSIEIEPKVWTETITKFRLKNAKNVKLSGFRKGKVPQEVALKSVSAESVLGEAANHVINETIKAMDSNAKVKAVDADVFPTPTVEIGKSFSEKEITFDIIYWIMPKVDIKDYKDLNINVISTEVTDKEVNTEIDNLLAREKMLTEKTSKVLAKGDQATFDFTGFIDGKEFPGGKAEKYDLEIGSGNFIPGFEDQMVGFKVGDEKEVKVTFPTDYHAKEMAGKKAVFKIKLHAVNTISKPALDETFIKNLKLPNKDIKTVAQFKTFLKENMQNYKKQQAYEQNITVLNNALFEHSKYKTIPEVIIEDEMKQVEQQFKQKIQEMKFKLEDFLAMTGKSKEDFTKEIHEQAKKNVIVYAALDNIIAKEKIKADEKTIAERYTLLAQTYKKPEAEIKKLIEKEYLIEALAHEKVITKLLEWNSKPAKNIKKK